MEALHLFLINRTNDPGFGGAGKFLLCLPVFAAGALPHRFSIVGLSFEVSTFLPLPLSSFSSLLDYTVFGKVFAVFAFFGTLLFTLLIAGFIFLLFT